MNDKNMRKLLEEERLSGFWSGVAFTIFMIFISVISWGVVFAPMGWWIK